MYEKCDLTLTISQNDFKGVNLLNSTFSLNESAPLFTLPAAAEEFFQKSLNMSYIGHMSGQKENLRVKFEELEEPIVTTPQHKPERIDFSRLKVEEVEESLQSDVREEDARYGFVRSFAREGAELFAQTGCTACSSLDHGKFDEAVFEVLLPNQEGSFEVLLITLNFDTVSAHVHFDEVPENKEIQIIAGKYRLILELESQKMAAWWYGRLHKMISQSKGKQFTLTRLLDREGEPFYTQRFTTESYFANNCKTGDIILFQDDHFFARAQRFFTRSDFDHVGMVVRDLNYGILIFQANSGRGVCLTPWKYVIKFDWYKTIPKISWRRLRNVQRSRQFNDTVEKFIISNLEKHYHISFAKITAQESVLRPAAPFKQGESAIEPEESGFFCSELVATTYKELGLLTRDKTSPNYQPACKFYPKDFSQRSGRKLDRGDLSHESTLFFEDILLKQAYNGAIIYN